MAKTNNFKIGVFVISAFLLLMAAIFALGAKELFREEWLIETYFDKSVQGLEVGSPVKYLGVTIGDIKDIGFVYERYATDYNYILVQMRIDPVALGSSRTEAREVTNKEVREGFQREVAKGLRVRLSMQGITGIGFLEASYIDTNNVTPLPINWEPKTPYLPSAHSTIEKISDSLERTLDSLSDADFAGISRNLNNTLSSLDNLLSNQVTSILTSFETNSVEFYAHLDTLGSKVNLMLTNRVDPILDNLMVSTEQLPELIEKINVSADSLENWTTDKRTSLNEVIENLRQITENVESFTEDARQYPSQLFFSDPPPYPEVLEQ
jgi:phospholipid/cholesterol/gamma-HCH transport system substrate-binding protein/paraquat-inducible protein B